MKARPKKKSNLAFWLLILAYGFSTYWVFTRSAPVIKQRPITIRVAHWQIERGPPDGFEAVIKRYEELNPRVHVIQQLVPGGVYQQWMRSNLAGATGPDIMEWGIWLPGQKDIPARYFDPITSELTQVNPYNRGSSQEKIPWQDTFHDKLAGPRRDSPDPGQIYAVTVTEVAVRLFCNIDLLRKITGSTAEPRTFDELRKIFAKTKQYSATQKKPVSGLAGSRDNGLWIVDTVIGPPMLSLRDELDDEGYMYVYKRKGLATYLQKRWSYAQPAMKAGIEMVGEVSQAMKPGFLQLRRDDAMMEFLSGEAVFLYTGSWDATSLRREASFKIMPMKLPQPAKDDPIAGKFIIGPGGEGIGETSVALYINKNGQHKAEALDFLRFVTSVEGNQLFSDASLWVPAVNGVRVADEIKVFTDYTKGHSFGQAPFDVIGSEQNREWIQNFYKLVGTQGNVDKFVDAIEVVMPKAMRTDLQNEYRNTLLLVRPQDGLIIAHSRLAGDSPEGLKHRTRQEETEMGQTMTEGLAFQMKSWLDETKDK